MTKLTKEAEEINNISEKDLMKALEKVNKKNLEFRKSLRSDAISMSKQASLSWKK